MWIELPYTVGPQVLKVSDVDFVRERLVEKELATPSSYMEGRSEFPGFEPPTPPIPTPDLEDRGRPGTGSDSVGTFRGTEELDGSGFRSASASSSQDKFVLSLPPSPKLTGTEPVPVVTSTSTSTSITTEGPDGSTVTTTTVRKTSYSYLDSLLTCLCATKRLQLPAPPP